MGVDPSKLPAYLRDKLIAAGHGDMIAKAKGGKRDDPEARLQREVILFLDRELAGKPVMWSAIMNGQYMKTEAARRKAHEQGRRAGTLDIVFVPLVGHPYRGKTLWAELKSDTGRPSDAQQLVLDALGETACVVRSLDDLIDFLRHWLIA